MEEEAVPMDVGDARETAEAAPALLSVHPLEKFVAIAIGPELRVFDLEGDCAVSLSDDSGRLPHSDAIRTICFSSNGMLFASAGDDKLVKIWATDSWRCVRTVSSEKRVSAVAISHDGLYVTFADKFGVVWIVHLDADSENQSSADKKAIPILGHYCSIITSLKFSPDGQFIASADRDFKIRITVFPRNPLKGAHEIQSFCLGHTDFVSCLAFVLPPNYNQGFLISGSGDSTVRLWDFISGCLLDTCEVVKKAGLIESTPSEYGSNLAVTDICASPDGSLVAIAIQSLHGVLLLNCKFAARTLSVAKVVSMEENYVPTSLGISSAADRLWMVMGASKLPTLGTAQLLARVRIISGFCEYLSDPNSQDPIVLEDNNVPGGGKLLLKLQGSLDVAKEEVALVVTAEAVKAAMRNLLNKKQYSEERREFRKRNRNDRKRKQ